MRKKALVIFGTRPEAIKICPLINTLKKRAVFETLVCSTGQHREMLDAVLDAFEVIPDFDLKVMAEARGLQELTAAMLTGIDKIIEKTEPDIVLVHGDTVTALSGALAAFYRQIPIGHVEAGLRTYRLDSPFPEEFSREMIDRISSFCFAPTHAAAENLFREQNIFNTEQQIDITGNTGIDALRTTVRKKFRDENLDWAAGSRLILLTAHRRENLGEPMSKMFRAIRRIVNEYEDVKAIYPVHMNPEVRQIAKAELADSDRIRLIEPLDVIAFHNYMEKSYLILTDSGGIQEEAPSLGKPVLVMRDTTERPEGISAGTLRLVGTDEATIYSACKELLDNSPIYEKMSKASNPYGDGYASERIADILETKIEKHS